MHVHDGMNLLLKSRKSSYLSIQESYFSYHQVMFCFQNVQCSEMKTSQLLIIAYQDFTPTDTLLSCFSYNG